MTSKTPIAGGAGGSLRFGRFVLERRLAVGGMAEVFVARSADGLGERLVVKRLFDHLHDDPMMCTMFLDEARLAARFDHPNVLRAFELTRIEGRYCLILELVTGVDLAMLARRSSSMAEPIPATFAIMLVEQAARGLGYAHALCDEDGLPLHVVHRDVSPQNLLVGHDGVLKVADFGVAKYRGSAPTIFGYVKGKASYMVPEQAAGGAVDARTDIYALGLVLFELLTGQPFYPRQLAPLALVSYVAALRDNTARLASVELPSAVRGLLARLLAVAPDERMSSMADVATELGRYLDALGRPSTSDLGGYIERLSESADVVSGPVHISGALQDPTVPIDAAVLAQLFAPSPPEPRRRWPLYRLGLATGLFVVAGALFHRLSPVTGTLQLSTDRPTDAYVGNRCLGTAPLTAELGAGDYAVVLVDATGQRRRVFQVTITAARVTHLVARAP